MYSEDADLARRYSQAGYPLRATSALLARHEGASSAPTPMLLALSFLGWLEYTSKWHGRLSATFAALVARVIYSVVLFALRVLAAFTGNRRVSAKVVQLEAMLFYIAEEGPPDGLREEEVRYHTAGPIATHIFRSYASRSSGNATL